MSRNTSETGNTPIDDAEWQAQERGLRAARDGAPAADGPDAAYRLVAKAAQSAPGSQPPADFAAVVVAHVARHEAGFERWLTNLLLAVFVIASGIVAAVYGGELWQTLQQGLGEGASGWVVAAISCAALSWIGSRLLELSAQSGRRLHAT